MNNSNNNNNDGAAVAAAKRIPNLLSSLYNISEEPNE